MSPALCQRCRTVAGTDHSQSECDARYQARFQRGDAELALRKRIEALCDDPWVARDHGPDARYQEGVVRRGAYAYGEFVSVIDLHIALDAEDPS